MSRNAGRMRREKVPARDLRIGDVIDLGGWRPPATVSCSVPYKQDTAQQSVQWKWPNDSTVNPKYRGKYDGAVWRRDLLITRLVHAPASETQRHVQIGSANYTIRG